MKVVAVGVRASEYHSERGFDDAEDRARGGRVSPGCEPNRIDGDTAGSEATRKQFTKKRRRIVNRQVKFDACSCRQSTAHHEVMTLRVSRDNET